MKKLLILIILALEVNIYCQKFQKEFKIYDPIFNLNDTIRFDFIYDTIDVVMLICDTSDQMFIFSFDTIFYDPNQIVYWSYGKLILSITYGYRFLDKRYWNEEKFLDKKGNDILKNIIVWDYKFR